VFGLKHLKRMREDFLGYCVEIERAHGDAAHYVVGGVRVFQFTNPAEVHEVLVAKSRSFLKPKRLKQVLGQWNGNGLVLNDGEPWVRQRRLVQAAFRQNELKAHSAAIARRAGQMLDGWAGRREIEATSELGRFTLGVVGEALFGAQVEAHQDRFVEEVAVLNETAMAEMSAPFVLPMWAPVPAKRRMRKAVSFLKGFVEGIIAERRRSSEGHRDLLSILLSAVDEEGDGGGMTDTQVRDEAINLLLGGNETTATGLTWTLHLLAEHPAIQEEIQKEVDEVLGDAAPTFEAIPRLRKVEMAFKEAMRLFPPAYVIAREAAADVSIGGYSIPGGATVQLLPYITQRDARWFEAPKEFRPSRFEAEDALPRGAYFPFAAGPRACVGKAFALMEATIGLAMLLRRFRVRPAGGKVEMEAQISLHPKGGLRLGIEPRASLSG
jgi:cytochrome P450